MLTEKKLTKYWDKQYNAPDPYRLNLDKGLKKLWIEECEGLKILNHQPSRRYV
jgi:hypothetical protein